MDEFGEYSSDVVEFPSTWDKNKSKHFAHTSILTDPLEEPQNKNVQTNESISVMVQTDDNNLKMGVADDKKLHSWLKKISSLVESELSKGVTPLFDTDSGYVDHDITIKLHQKIIDDVNCTHGAATWLSIRTNNAPLLVLTTTPIHNDWCDHATRTIKIFCPKRLPSQDVIVYSELVSLPLRSCIKSLSTNRFNKDIFAGGTVFGDLYIWKYETQINSEKIKELHFQSTDYGPLNTMDWLTEHEILTCHSDGVICLWQIGQEIIKNKT